MQMQRLTGVEIEMGGGGSEIDVKMESWEGGGRATHMRASQTPAGRRVIQTSRSGESSAHLCRESWTGGAASGRRFARAEAEETNQNQSQTRTNQRRKQDEKMKKVQEKRGLVKFTLTAM